MSQKKYMSYNSQKQYDSKIKEYIGDQINDAVASAVPNDNFIKALSGKSDTLKTSSGSAITMSDSAKAPIQGLKLFGKTTQDGAPTPAAPVPLVSAGDGGSVSIRVAGKNLVPNDAGTTLNNGVTFTANSDGSITLNGTSSGDWAANVRLSLKKYPAGKYLVSGCPKDRKGTNARIVVGSMDGSVVAIETGNGATIEVAKETELYFDIRTALGDVFDGMTFYPMMRLASITDATYEPYKEVQTLTLSTPNGLPGIPITSGGNYTDETGQQWVCDEVDFARGVYVQRVFTNVFSDASGWVLSGATSEKKRFGYQALKGLIKGSDTQGSKANLLCSSFPITSAEGTWNAVEGICADISGIVYAYCGEIAQTLEAWSNYLSGNPVTVMAALAVPIETPLSAEELAAYAALHTNYPNTTILNDGGAGMEVKYCTPLTSVPMVHGEADSGKILAIDKHGCVTKISSEQFGAIDVDFDISNEAEINPINADTLGGFPPEHYLNNTPKAGFIYPLATSTVPDGFLLCDGAEYLRAEYPELFAAIGTMYGEGDGSTTFNIPNLQTRVPVGKGEGYELGDVGGEAEHTLTVDEMPRHDHLLPLYTSTGANKSGANVGYTENAGGNQWSSFGYTGGSQSHNNMQPYTVVNYIIATGKKTGINITDIIIGSQAIPLGVEYGGTGATSTEMARKNLEITPDNIGAMSMELLWENASPTSEFGEQTINVDMSEYPYCFIRAYRSDVNYRAVPMVMFKPGERFDLIYNATATLYHRSDNQTTTTSIAFAAAYGDSKVNNCFLIPFQLFGIKGVSE